METFWLVGNRVVVGQSQKQIQTRCKQDSEVNK